MTRGLFLYPQPYGFHAPSYAYVENLRSLGIDMHYGGRDVQPPADAPTEFPSYVHHLRGHAGGRAFAKYAAELVDTLKPDFVHVVHYRGAGLLRLYSKARHKMTWVIEVRTVHVENKNQEPTRRLSFKDRITWLETLSYDVVIANTETIKRRMSPSRRPINVIPTGASWDHFNRPDVRSQREQIRQQLQIPEDAAVIVYAGTLSQSRNLDRMIKALAGAVSTHPNTHLLIVGGSANVLPEHDPGSQKLRSQVTELGLEKQVHFVGRIPFVEVPSYYAAADIGISYVPPDTAYETQWPTKLIEIMMAGLIPVTNITIGARAVYQHDDAVIACGGEVDDLTTAIRQAIDLLSPEAEPLRKQLIANARTRAKQLDWKEIIRGHLLPIYANNGIIERSSFAAVAVPEGGNS